MAGCGRPADSPSHIQRQTRPGSQIRSRRIGRSIMRRAVLSSSAIFVFAGSRRLSVCGCSWRSSGIDDVSTSSNVAPGYTLIEILVIRTTPENGLTGVTGDSHEVYRARNCHCAKQIGGEYKDPFSIATMETSFPSYACEICRPSSETRFWSRSWGISTFPAAFSTIEKSFIRNSFQRPIFLLTKNIAVVVSPRSVGNNRVRSREVEVENFRFVQPLMLRKER